VNPEILRWAREQSGLTLGEAADKLEIAAAKGVAPVDRLAALERGEVVPSRPMLLRMCKQYRRPLLIFYLESPPRTVARGQDFRTLAGDATPSEEVLLDALLRDVRTRQAIVRDALEGADEAEPVAYVGSMSLANGPEAVAIAIQQTLQFDLQAFRGRQDAAAAFGYLRDCAEAARCFVLLVGDLGSHHSALGVDTFRGFALADRIAPFAVINDHDAKSAWSFTLVHELAHIWLGQTGVSGGRAELDVELFCNEVAATTLLPRAELATLDLGPRDSLDQLIETIGRFASQRNVSSSMVAYGLFQTGRLTQTRWQRVANSLAEMWAAERDRRRSRARGQEGGPDYYVVRRHRVGSGLAGTVSRLLRAGELSTTQAGKVLGVRPKLVGKLLGFGDLPTAGSRG
jgi:Zn-dependent peptidase ImmA (M78 family)/transcriptional regulator with XRE-family HTH domain